MFIMTATEAWAAYFSAMPRSTQPSTLHGIKMEDVRGGSLISLDGMASSRTVGVSASVILPCTIKVHKKISSGTGSPG